MNTINFFNKPNKHSNDNSSDSADLNNKNTNIEIPNEVALWKAVVMQALLDLQAKAPTLKQKLERAETYRWFNINDEDFLFVCMMSNIQPETLIKSAARIYKQSRKKDNTRRKTIGPRVTRKSDTDSCAEENIAL